MAAGNTLASWTPPANAYPSTNYPQLILRNQRPVLAFDTTTQETCYFEGVLPQSYAGGSLTVYLTWSAATAVTGTIGWDVTWEYVNDAALDTDADGFATAQTVTAATVSGTSGITSTTNVACAVGATGTDSLVAGGVFRLRIRRDVANDTAAGDADLHAVEVRES